ncbi:MAG: caspase family protein [Myxococcota bacterium]
MIGWLVAIGVGCGVAERPEHAENPLPSEIATRTACGSHAVVPSSDGVERVAVLVGVGEYAADVIDDLRGPPNDVDLMKRMLTARFGVAASNVCALKNEGATESAFREAMGWMTQVANADTVAIIYFSGHGSQAADRGGDEPDGWDETLLFHDARYGDPSSGELVDDALNAMLHELQAKTENVTVIVDACNSGSATRSIEDVRIRAMPRTKLITSANPKGDGASRPDRWVTIAAALDGTSAWEEGGQGLLTGALVELLMAPASRTWQEVALQLPARVQARRDQIPVFTGPLNRLTFGGALDRPPTWEVTALAAVWSLSGVATPGWVSGAHGRVYPSTAIASELNDPTKARGRVELIDVHGLGATARPLGTFPSEPAIGDLVVLEPRAASTVRFPVLLRESAMADHRATELRTRIDAEPSIAVDPRAEFEIDTVDGSFQVWGPEGALRKVVEDLDGLLTTLVGFARQRALLGLRPPPTKGLRHGETIEVRVVPSNEPSTCGRTHSWQTAPLGAHQVLPVCHAFELSVRLSEEAPGAMSVFVILLSSDGSIHALSQHGEILHPGDHARWPRGSRSHIVAGPPIGVHDHALVFAVPVGAPKPWEQLAKLDPNVMGRSMPQLAPWTVSHASIEVRANP